VVDINSGRGYARVHRIDRARTVSVQGEVDGRIANAIDILNDTKIRLLPGLQSRHPSVTVVFSGQSEEGSTTALSIARGFILGIFGVFLLLSFQFRSYVDPLAVMTVIPLALIGAVWGHLLMGLDLSMPSMMGLVSLAGIVVNDSILLVEFLKRRLKEGLSVSAAAVRASRERFRAVLLTSLTTVAGLLPILAERSPQAQILIPLITSLVFGLMVTTVLVLLLVPAVYTILDDFGVAGARRQGILEERR